MKITGKVLSAKTEERDMVGKDGNKRHLKIHHIVLLSKNDGENEVVSIKSFNDNLQLPKVGEEFTTSFRKYENNNGIAEVFV